MIQPPYPLTILLEDLEFGGTQRYAVNLLKNLDRNLFTPELWVLRGGEDMLPLVKETRTRVTWMSRSKRVGPQSLFNLVMAFMKQRPALLYTLTALPNIWGRIFGYLSRVPVIVSGYRNLRPGQYERWLWPISRRIVCNAQALQETMSRIYKVPPTRVVVIPNGVDTVAFQPNPAGRDLRPRVVFIGRLVWEKDPETLLAGFITAARRLPTVHFDIIGAGPFKDGLATAIDRQALGDRIMLRENTNDVRPFLERAWIFVLASVQEGSPNVLLEAMAAGLPIVATRVGGIPELVDDGQTGRLVPPRDPQSLAEAIVQLLTDEPQREAMAYRARTKAVRLHSLDIQTRRLEAVFIEELRMAGIIA